VLVKERIRPSRTIRTKPKRSTKKRISSPKTDEFGADIVTGF